MSILDALISHISDWVPIPPDAHEEVKELARLHSIRITWQDGSMQARLDALPACVHAGEHRKTESGTVCVDCGEIVSKPVAPPPLPSEDRPWNKWLQTTGHRRQPVREAPKPPVTTPEPPKRVRVADQPPTVAAEAPAQPDAAAVPTESIFPVSWDGKKRLAFGEALICYRCHGRLRPERWTKEKKDKRTGKIIPPQLIPADEYSRDPERKTDDERCHRCNGHGLIPNIGPQPQDTEVMDIDANIRREQQEARRARYAPSAGQRTMEDDPGDGGSPGPARPPRRRKPRVGGGRSARLLRPIPDPLAGSAQRQEGVGGSPAVLPDAGPG